MKVLDRYTPRFGRSSNRRAYRVSAFNREELCGCLCLLVTHLLFLFVQLWSERPLPGLQRNETCVSRLRDAPFHIRRQQKNSFSRFRWFHLRARFCPFDHRKPLVLCFVAVRHDTPQILRGTAFVSGWWWRSSRAAVATLCAARGWASSPSSWRFSRGLCLSLKQACVACVGWVHQFDQVVLP